MALSSAEEAQIRLLIAEETELLNLASNEATILSNLAIARITLSDLPSASSINDADLYLTRQGINDKSVTALLLADYINARTAGFVKKIGDTMSGPLLLNAGGDSVTPPVDDNDTSIATTAFVKRAIDNLTPFTTGVRLLFAQPAAPLGWVQVVSDTSNNRMIRVTLGDGGNSGGVHDPSYCDKTPAHVHSFASNPANVGHWHTFTTGIENTYHEHGFTTGGMSSNASHGHGLLLPDAVTDSPNTGDAYFSGYAQNTVRADRTTATVNTDHIHSGGTGSQNRGHNHQGTTDGQHQTHSHDGTTNLNTGSTNWTPRHLNVILCEKQ